MSTQEAFAKALAQLWVADKISVEDPAALAATITARFAAGGDEAAKAATELARSGVRAQWNKILCDSRSASLAARIQPLVVEPLLDVLSGDGSVCRALSELGVARLSATERAGDYSESVLPTSVAFRTFDPSLDLSEFGASTALLSAVLHHEEDPVMLLESLARANTPRWIVVENCVTPEFSRPFHQLADRFFNNCLNDFGVHCGEQHRTLAEWEGLLRQYGTVDVAEESFTVPGIPFPYSLLVVNRP